MADDQQTPHDWHRLFGMMMTDLFTGAPFAVELERDVSIQQQFLDVVVGRRRPGRFAGRLPDGLTGLAAHNLITFKSHHEALDAWTIDELIGHYVAYRKHVSPSPSKLIPADQFRRLAVCVRRPRKLPRQAPWRRHQPGVYDYRWGATTIRVVVAREVSRESHTAPWHLFSSLPDLVGFGQSSYPQRSALTSALLDRLFGKYREEGLVMPYTMQEFMRDYIKWKLPTLSRVEREDVLRSLPAEERLAGIPAEERLAGLSVEQIRRYLDRAAAGQQSPARKPRRKK